jgi:hypothetical protein
LILNNYEDITDVLVKESKILIFTTVNEKNKEFSTNIYVFDQFLNKEQTIGFKGCNFGATFHNGRIYMLTTSIMDDYSLLKKIDMSDQMSLNITCIDLKTKQQKELKKGIITSYAWPYIAENAYVIGDTVYFFNYKAKKPSLNGSISDIEQDLNIIKLSMKNNSVTVVSAKQTQYASKFEVLGKLYLLKASDEAKHKNFLKILAYVIPNNTVRSLDFENFGNLDYINKDSGNVFLLDYYQSDYNLLMLDITSRGIEKIKKVLKFSPSYLDTHTLLYFRTTTAGLQSYLISKNGEHAYLLKTNQKTL